nr:ribonuclease H-like domain, reverse transcriptase, RNA-dependent DNA polymerase [Tanacetum cinerariifolium]
MMLTFADTHNMIAYLNKSDASEGFNQIIDFLNGSYIAYALTVNPTIYVSCIKQFWNTVAVKQSNDVTRLQALVDKKKVVVTEATIRDALHLDDAEGVDCLPNEEIFTTLARMHYEKPSTKLTFYKAFFSSQWKFLIHTILQSMSAKRTSWNEFSSVMASAVICLSTVREPEEQGDAAKQVNDDNAAEEHVTAVDDGEDFPMSLLQEALDACATLARRVEHLEHDKVAQDLEIIKLKTKVKKLQKTNKVKSLKLRRLRKADIYHIDMDHATKVLSMQEDKPEIQEAVEVVTTAKLITKVVATVSETVSAAAVTETVSAAAVTAAPVKVASKDKGKCIMVEEPKPIKKKQQVELDEAYARKLQEELNQDIDWEVAMDHVKQKAKENPYVHRYQVMKKRPQTEAQARRNMMMYLNNTARFRLDYFKGMSYDDIRIIFEAKFNANMELLLKSKEQMEEEESKAIAIINETPAHKATRGED